jgi:glutathione peroxidase
MLCSSTLRLENSAPERQASSMSFHELSATTIDGQPKQLSDYAGKVALVVNTASECGYTPQYAGLERLWRELRDRGLVVLGFPSNDFGGQEPGSEAKIREFCDTHYQLTFPMFSKVTTKGDGQHPVYRFLTADLGVPKWNFYKYLVDRNGRVLQAFSNRVEPNDPKLRAAIETALG